MMKLPWVCLPCPGKGDPWTPRPLEQLCCALGQTWLIINGSLSLLILCMCVAPRTPLGAVRNGPRKELTGRNQLPGPQLGIRIPKPVSTLQQGLWATSSSIEGKWPFPSVKHPHARANVLFLKKGRTDNRAANGIPTGKCLLAHYSRALYPEKPTAHENRYTPEFQSQAEWRLLSYFQLGQ